MASSISGLNEIDLLSMAAPGAQQHSVDGSTERRREFDNILLHSLPRFRRLAMRMLRNPEDAEDAVQDAMLSAHRHIARFDGRSQMSTWLTSIVINAVRMQIRRRSRRFALPLDQDSTEGKWSADEWPVDPKPTPEQTVQAHELRALVIKLVARLPPSQRAAVELRQQNGLSIKQAAETLGVPEGTVKARLARARAQLIHRYRKVTSLDSKARQRASLSGHRRDRTERLPSTPAAVLNPQGGYENRVGA